MTAPTHEGEIEATIPPVFRRLLVNTLVTGVTSSFLWFALTFWVYLETRSVVATGVIGGAFSISSAVIGPIFGTFVDRHRKKTALIVTTAIAAGCFGLAAATYVAAPHEQLLQLDGPWFWVLVAVTLVGSVTAQMRGIALSTCVTLLVPEHARDCCLPTSSPERPSRALPARASLPARLAPSRPRSCAASASSRSDSWRTRRAPSA